MGVLKHAALLLSSGAVAVAQLPTPPPPPPAPSGCPDGYPSGLVVDVTQTFQKMDGCGYSEAFQRGGWAYNALDDENRAKMLDVLHNTTTGVGMSMLRVGIGSSPNSTIDHMNSIEPVSPGSPDSPPDYKWDGNDSSQVWWAQEAQKRGCIYFYGDAWSADGYMKTNGDDANGNYLCGVRGTNCPTGNWMTHYANKLVQWVKFYAQEGINITHLGFVNEPDQTVTYASMASDGYQAYDFLQVLRPIVKAYREDLRITWSDSAGWEQARLKFKDLMNAAGPNWQSWIDLATSHGYDQVPTIPFTIDHPVWQTEWAALSSTFAHPYWATGDEAEGKFWANAISSAFVNSNVSLFTHWIGAATGNGASQLIMVNNNNTFETTSRTWAFAGFCRYTRPGSVRVYANATDPAYNQYLAISAFTTADTFPDGGKLAVQIINNGPKDATLPLTLQGVPSVSGIKTYVVNNEHNLDLVSGMTCKTGGNITTTIPAQSMVVLSLSM